MDIVEFTRADGKKAWATEAAYLELVAKGEAKPVAKKDVKKAEELKTAEK